MFYGRVDNVIGRLDLEEQKRGECLQLAYLLPWLERSVCSQGVSNLISKEFKYTLHIMRSTYLFPMHKNGTHL